MLSINLELLRGAGQPGTEPLAGEALNRVQDLARSLHDLSHRLHPSKLRLIGLVPALQALQRELSRPDTTIAFTHEGVPANLPLDLTLSVFRVVQEAVQNAVKHGRARTVTVDLRGGSNVLALTVSDDGVGFDVNAAWGEGLGLISMGERIEAIGGYARHPLDAWCRHVPHDHNAAREGARRRGDQGREARIDRAMPAMSCRFCMATRGGGGYRRAGED